MKILCVGAGPANLYFSICAKLLNPLWQIYIYERNPSNVTNGWGVVLPQKTLDLMYKQDIKSAVEIQKGLFDSNHINVKIYGNDIQLNGYNFSAIGRLKLLNILQKRAQELGVKLYFEKNYEFDSTCYEQFDLIVVGDGANSKIRQQLTREFGAEITHGRNKYAWMGTQQNFNRGFSFIFEKPTAGWIWAHAYQFDESTSTVVIECQSETWERLNLGPSSISRCEQIFAKHLGENSLLANSNNYSISNWLNFTRVRCKKWFFKNLVLIGDVAHTAHFSIGSGTRLAIEDAIMLASCLNINTPLDNALSHYHHQRKSEVERTCAAADHSMDWFEHVDNYASLSSLEFCYSLLNRAKTTTHESIIQKNPFLQTAARI